MEEVKDKFNKFEKQTLDLIDYYLDETDELRYHTHIFNQ